MNKITIGVLLFKTKEKKNEKSPDYSASGVTKDKKFCDIGAGWKKISAKGDTYLSLSLDVEVLKQLIMDKMSTLNSDGSPQPDFRQPEERKDDFDSF